MEYRYLSDTGIRISELCMGTMSFGGDADEHTSLELYKAARDAGINIFDTADHYNGGLSEEYLGRFIGSDRHNIVVSTKAYFPMSSDVNDCGASRKHLIEAVEGSLKRLNTDYLDILTIHHFDEQTSLNETMRALDDLISSGKVLYPAASNFSAWQIMKAQGIAEREGYYPFKSIQPMYSLVKRQAEVELLPMALSEQIGVISYSPLGAGLLTGKYGKKTKTDIGRISTNENYKIRYGDTRYHDTTGRYVKFAEENGYNPISLAIRWASTHNAVTAPIIGARNVSQLKDSLKSVDISMTSDLREQISALSVAPPPATDRTEELIAGA